MTQAGTIEVQITATADQAVAEINKVRDAFIEAAAASAMLKVAMKDQPWWVRWSVMRKLLAIVDTIKLGGGVK